MVVCTGRDVWVGTGRDVVVNTVRDVWVGTGRDVVGKHW